MDSTTEPSSKDSMNSTSPTKNDHTLLMIGYNPLVDNDVIQENDQVQIAYMETCTIEDPLEITSVPLNEME